MVALESRNDGDRTKSDCAAGDGHASPNWVRPAWQKCSMEGSGPLKRPTASPKGGGGRNRELGRRGERKGKEKKKKKRKKRGLRYTLIRASTRG